MRRKPIYVSSEAYRRLQLLAAPRGQTPGEVVEDLVRLELDESANPWTSPGGLWLQQKVLAEVWDDPALDVYNDGQD